MEFPLPQTLSFRPVFDRLFGLTVPRDSTKSCRAPGAAVDDVPTPAMQNAMHK
jgi:hypothetical protein